ncbi:hypothetical protein D3C71_1711810 [compost metagenome]
MGLRDSDQHGVTQHLAVGQRHVRRGVNALAAREGSDGAVLEVRVQLDLVCGDGTRPHGGDGVAQQGDVEVRHADLPRQALGFRLGQCAHELGHGHRAAG